MVERTDGEDRRINPGAIWIKGGENHMNQNWEKQEKAKAGFVVMLVLGCVLSFVFSWDLLWV